MLALLFLALIAGGIIIALFPPLENAWYPKCTFHQVTGYHCPGCGTARAIHALLNGRILQALAYNPFTVAALAWLVWEPVSLGISRWRHRPKTTLSARVVWTFVALLLVFGVLRNIPNSPFTRLAPHEIDRATEND